MMMASSRVCSMQTPGVRAVRYMQAAVLGRSRRSVKPSMELLQIVPDLVEIFREAEPHRADRRQRGLHWALLPGARRMLDIPRSWPRVTSTAGYSTGAQTLPVSALRSQSDLSDAGHHEEGSVDPSQLGAVRHENPSARNFVDCPSPPTAQARFPLSNLLADFLGRSDSGTTATRDRVRTLVEEVDRRKRSGGPVLESVSVSDFEHLLSLESPSARKRFLYFLLRKERARAGQAAKKATRWAAREAGAKPEPTVHNMIIRPGQSQAEDALNAWTAARSLLFGPPLAFDLSFDVLMSRRELANAVLQLGLCLKVNKTLAEPFHVHLTGVAAGGAAEHELQRIHGQNYDQLMASVTDKPPQGVFPSQRLIYLTADSPNVLSASDDRDAVYIIGGFVDRCVRSGVSLAKAEAAGLAHARLPLDEHLRWRAGTKNLTLDQVLSILAEVRRTAGDWGKALEHVPRRKHHGPRTTTTV